MEGTTIALVAFVFMFAGGIVIYLLDIVKSKGKVQLEACNLKLFYKVAEDVETITGFSLELKFINTTGYQKNIEKLYVKFFDGNKLLDLQFNGLNMIPGQFIRGKSSKQLQYTPTIFHKDKLAPLEAIKTKAFMEVHFKVDKDKHVGKIFSDEMEFIQIDNAVVA